MKFMWIASICQKGADLVSTKRSRVRKQTCSFQLQICLSMYDLSVVAKALKGPQLCFCDLQKNSNFLSYETFSEFGSVYIQIVLYLNYFTIVILHVLILKDYKYSVYLLERAPMLERAPHF